MKVEKKEMKRYMVDFEVGRCGSWFIIGGWSEAHVKMIVRQMCRDRGVEDVKFTLVQPLAEYIAARRSIKTTANGKPVDARCKRMIEQSIARYETWTPEDTQAQLDLAIGIAQKMA